MSGRPVRPHALSCALVACLAAVALADGPDDPSKVFEQRILPIFRSPEPSSCTECHLAAVELKDYLRPTADETFLSLRDQGLVDVKAPASSRILVMIRMAPAQANPLVSKRRDAEAAAFEAWILASAARPELAGAPPLEIAKRAAPVRPVEVIRHARKATLLESFREAVWRDVERCAGCHRPPANAKQEEKFGPRVSWIVTGDAEATLDGLLERKLLDLKAPEKSLLLRKPTEQVAHVGGRKMLIGDESWTRWVAWIRDYARAVNDGYARAEDLPAAPEETTILTDCWVRIEIPEALDGSVMALEVFPWDAQTAAWSKTRIASASRHAEKGFQQTVFLHAPRGSELAKDLERQKTILRGRYLVRIYADKRYDPKKGKPAKFDAKQLVGELEVDREWATGYGSMNRIGRVD